MRNQPNFALAPLFTPLEKTFARDPARRGTTAASVTWAPMFPNHSQPWFARDQALRELERRILAATRAQIRAFKSKAATMIGVARVMLHQMNLKTGQLTCSRLTIAAALGISRKSVERAHKALKALRLLDWVTRHVRVEGKAWAREQITNSYAFRLAGWQARDDGKPEPGTSGEPEDIISRMGARELARADRELAWEERRKARELEHEERRAQMIRANEKARELEERWRKTAGALASPLERHYTPLGLERWKVKPPKYDLAQTLLRRKGELE